MHRSSNNMRFPCIFHTSAIPIILPFLFASSILTTSEIFSAPRETDIDWENWNAPELDPSEILDTKAQNCKCGTGLSRLNVTKIVGGVTSRNHAWPWMAAIVDVRTPPNSAICGASLISNWYILTAAHCLPTLTENGLSSYRIYLGGNRINGTNITDRVIARIGEIRAHPGYVGGGFDNDIALIRLSAPVKFTKNINPVCLSQHGDPFIGHDAIVAGWGILAYGFQVGSNSLREVHLKIQNNSVCQAEYPILTPSMVCAYAVHKDSCQGDSGGPLIALKRSTANTDIYTQVGVVSFGKECGTVGVPGVYTRVSKYLSFIKANTRDSVFCQDSFT